MRSNVWLLLLTSLVAVTLIGCHPPTSPAPACASDVADHQGQKPAKGKAELDARAVFK